jgi:zinc protease
VTQHQEVVREERDGLRVLWVEQAAPLRAVLIFRVGRADETLRTSGISHIVEHLALWRHEERAHAFNGWVDDTVTGFWASGTVDQVVAFVSDVSSALRALPVDRLDIERRVLASEGAGLAGDALGTHRSLRFGPSSYGLVNHYEFGIDWLASDAIQQWADEWFTAENAVLTLTGRPPDDLPLVLPHGQHRPAPSPRELEGLGLPARTEGPSGGGVSISGMGTRSSALHAGFNIWIDRAVTKLRRLEGMSYAPTGAYDVLDGQSVIVFAIADCRRGDAPVAERLLLEIADDLGASGPTSDEMADDARRLEEWISHPDAVASRLDWHARDELLGLEPVSAAELLSERQALTTGDVAAAIAEPLQSLLVLGPTFPGASDPQRFRTLERNEPPAQRGRSFKTNAQWRAFRLDMTVDLGEEGITYTQRYTRKHLPPTWRTTMLFTDLIAGVEMPSGAITLVSRFGDELTLHTERFERGDDLLTHLEEELGEDRLIPLSHGQRRVVKAVHDALNAEQRSALGDEIDHLPLIVGERETIRLLASASRRNERSEKETGLVAITDLRAFYIFDGPGGTDIREFPLGTSKASVSGVIKKKLTLQHENTRVELTDFRPSERLQAAHGLLHQTHAPH